MAENKVELDTEICEFEAPAVPESFKLSDFKGKNLVLYFYPKDNTPGCTTESIGFRDHYKEFKKADTEIVGISRDTMHSHENFSRKLELPFPLISDTDESACSMFDVIKTKMRYGKPTRGIERSTFLIDKTGKLIKVWRNVKVAGHVKEVLDTVKALG